MEKINQKQLDEIKRTFLCSPDQDERIKQILFDNHIYVFKKYYKIYKDLSNVDFVNDFYEMYKLDLQIGKLFFSAVSRIEISLKTKLANFLEQKYGDNSLWKEKIFTSGDNNYYEISINKINRHLKKASGYIFNSGSFTNREGQTVGLKNYQGLNVATIGNVIYLIKSFNKEDLKEFNDVYFPNINYEDFDNLLLYINDLRNHVYHNGKIIEERKVFTMRNGKKTIIIDGQDYLLEKPIDFIVMFWGFMNIKPTKSFVKNIEELFHENKMTKYFKFYGFEKSKFIKLKKVLKIGDENNEDRY